MQDITACSSPSQPLWPAVPNRHALNRVLFPLPQVVEHSVQEIHSVQDGQVWNSNHITSPVYFAVKKLMLNFLSNQQNGKKFHKIASGILCKKISQTVYFQTKNIMIFQKYATTCALFAGYNSKQTGLQFKQHYPPHQPRYCILCTQ